MDWLVSNLAINMSGGIIGINDAIRSLPSQEELHNHFNRLETSVCFQFSYEFQNKITYNIELLFTASASMWMV